MPRLTTLKLVGGDYFQALGIPLLRGRHLNEQDNQDSRQVAVVNEKLAGLLWPEHEPIGRKFKSRTLELSIVGVVADVKDSLEGEAEPIFYVSYRQLLGEIQPRFLTIRTSSDPVELVELFRAEARALDSGMIIDDVVTIETILESFFAPQSLSMMLLGTFAVVALALAAAGIYGVISYSVRERTREIGVRRTLGAQAGDLINMFVLRGLRQVAVGVAIGGLLSLALTRAIENQLWGVTRNDPMTLLGVIALLALTGMIGSYLPARKATAIEAADALRHL